MAFAFGPLTASACAHAPSTAAAPQIASVVVSHPAAPGDADGDGLSDFAEEHKYRTDPHRWDTAGDGVSDGEWARRKEFTYTITTLFRVLRPASPVDMSDDYQDARVVSQDADSYTVEVVHYPLNTNGRAVAENPTWRRDYASMTDFLAPSASANWDAAMRDELVAQLRADGIDPYSLGDRELVLRVSRWALARSRHVDRFGIWFVELADGPPHVAPELRAAFDHQRQPAASDEEGFAVEVLGREMFRRQVHGSCTSSSVYLSTILRALGIPTRTAVFSPAVDPNDASQITELVSHIRHDATRVTVEAGLRALSRGTGTTFVNHMMNEVFVGSRWVRLNYATLGQNTVDAKYYGLLTHVATVRDISELHLPATWGKRYASGVNASPRLSSINPYMLLNAADHVGKYARIDDRPAPTSARER